jgi:HK97 family phage portal protein
MEAFMPDEKHIRPNRLKMALRVLLGDAKAISLMTPTWRAGQPQYSEVSFESMVKQGWRKNELIFACIAKTADTAAQIQLQVVKPGKDDPIKDHPLKQLISRPNPFMSEFDFWNAVVIYQKLAGIAYFEKERTNGGQVTRLWPLRPDWMAVIPDSKKKIGGYQYTVPGLPPIPLRVEDVLDFPLFDPINQYRGYPPVAVAGRVGDVDNSVTDYLKLFFEKGGTPPGLLTSTQRLLDAQVTDIRRRWRDRYGGFEHWMEPAVLDSDAKYQQIGMTFKDMGFEVLDGRDEARICMVLKVPPILVGAKIGLDRATYSNYGEARRAWWEDDLLPMYANYQDVLDQGLAPEFGDDIATQWDTSKVPALQEERNARWTRATAALVAGGITVGQFCVEVGMPDPGSAGKFYLRSSATVEVPAGTGIRETPEPAPAPDVQLNDGVDNEPVDDGEPGNKSVKAATNAPDDVVRRKHERVIKKAMQDYFDGQLERVKKDAAKNNGH